MRPFAPLSAAMLVAALSSCSTETPVTQGEPGATRAGSAAETAAAPQTGAAAASTGAATAAVTPGDPAAPGGRALRDRILGVWRFETTPTTSSALQGGVEKATGKKLAPAPGQIAEMLSQMTIEVTPDALITRNAGKVFSTEPYEIVEGSSNELTLKLKKGTRPERYTLQDDDTLIVTTKELGVITMKRVR
jgi:hypothetical protein